MRLTCTTALVGAFVSIPFPALAQDLNRLDLHNGSDALTVLQAPYAGSPVGSFASDGDLYWKVFSADVLQRADGSARLMGVEAVAFDTDFFASEVLWDYSVTTGFSATSGAILPDFSSSGAFVAGLSTTGTIFGSAGCAPAGYVSGWVYSDTFVDSLGAPTALIELTADGQEDWVFTHYFPAPGIADQNLYGPLNSCGTSGDVTLQWGLSNNEQLPDWTGLGISGYGGVNLGGSGVFAPIQQGNQEGSHLGFFFEEPTMTPGVLTSGGLGLLGVDGGPTIDFGTVTLRTPSACPPGPVIQLTKRMYDEGADEPAGCNISLFAGTLGAPLLFSFDFLGVPYNLNPADPAWLPSFIACNAPYNHGFVIDPAGPTPRSAYSQSNTLMVGCWAGTIISWQGVTFDLCSGMAAAVSQVFRQRIQ